MKNQGLRALELRRQRGLTQDQVAAKVGVSQQSIEAFENGKTKQPKWIAELASLYGVPVEFIRTGKITRPPPIDRGFLSRCFSAVERVETDFEKRLPESLRVELAARLYERHYMADHDQLREAARSELIRLQLEVQNQ